jgi:hypothetical protein
VIDRAGNLLGFGTGSTKRMLGPVMLRVAGPEA